MLLDVKKCFDVKKKFLTSNEFFDVKKRLLTSKSFFDVKKHFPSIWSEDMETNLIVMGKNLVPHGTHKKSQESMWLLRDGITQQVHMIQNPS